MASWRRVCTRVRTDASHPTPSVRPQPSAPTHYDLCKVGAHENRSSVHQFSNARRRAGDR